MGTAKSNRYWRQQSQIATGDSRSKSLLTADGKVRALLTDDSKDKSNRCWRYQSQIVNGNSKVNSVLAGNSEVKSLLTGESKVKLLLTGDIYVKLFPTGDSKVKCVLTRDSKVEVTAPSIAVAGRQVKGEGVRVGLLEAEEVVVVLLARHVQVHLHRNAARQLRLLLLRGRPVSLRETTTCSRRASQWETLTT